MAIENEPDANEVQEDDLEDDYEEVEEVRRASEHQISETDDVSELDPEKMGAEG